MLVINHRGGKGFGPENTLASLRGALEAGVGMIETDVRSTSDGVPVIHHNALLSGRLLRDYSFEELRREHPHVPTLGEYLDLCNGRCLVDLEAKSVEPASLATPVLELGMERQVIITSFNLAFLIAMKEAYAILPTGLLLKRPRRVEELLVIAREGGIKVLLPRQGLIDANLVEKCHAQGISVYAWTVNRLGSLHRLAAMGVDAVITDRYEVMQAACREAREPLLLERPAETAESAARS
ncbi:MAG: glycerophosphodiester phosphodiesterase [Candidatus Geothermincolia bacterium]